MHLWSLEGVIRWLRRIQFVLRWKWVSMVTGTKGWIIIIIMYNIWLRVNVHGDRKTPHRFKIKTNLYDCRFRCRRRSPPCQWKIQIWTALNVWICIAVKMEQRESITLIQGDEWMSQWNWTSMERWWGRKRKWKYYRFPIATFSAFFLVKMQHHGQDSAKIQEIQSGTTGIPAGLIMYNHFECVLPPNFILHFLL